METDKVLNLSGMYTDDRRTFSFGKIQSMTIKADAFCAGGTMHCGLILGAL